LNELGEEVVEDLGAVSMRCGVVATAVTPNNYASQMENCTWGGLLGRGVVRGRLLAADDDGGTGTDAVSVWKAA
jgi:hypothetical protein